MNRALATSAFRTWQNLLLSPGGRSLIEASAGTGKTWTIAVLYLRLLLEQRLTPKQVVVTTFTDAAAGELRERIRGQLLGAERFGCGLLASAATPIEGATEDERWLQAFWISHYDEAGGTTWQARVAEDLNHLRLALAELDVAPIGTLHGLCRKILADFPFESGSAFGLGEMVSSQTLLDTLAKDVWRQLKQAPAHPDVPALACDSIGAVKRHLKAYMAPGVAMRAVDAPEVSLDPSMAGPIRQLLGRKVFTSRRTFKDALAELADYLESSPRDPSLLPELARLAPPDWSEHLKPEALADDAVRQVLDHAAAAARQLQLAPWAYWVAQARQWREQRLTASGQLTFDELIERVHRALPEGGSALADRLFETWPVAMVDEFQDTDVLQYGILDRIYRDRAGGHRGRLVMIGDPKQAIYRFRGGDIHAYLKARADAQETLGLDTNFRSSRALVAAYNAFYDLAGTQLGSDPLQAIRYEPVKASARCDELPYEVDGEPCPQPLQLHFWRDCPDDADGRRSAALTACANQIVELLTSGRHAIAGQPLQPGDIAVLLPNNNDIGTLRDLLRERNVPCVSSARSSVFQSDWARELQIVLYAIHHPRDEAALRAALATRLGGLRYEQLRALRDQPGPWQEHGLRFQRLGALWRSGGVLAVVQQLIHQAASRLFTGGDGERSLTDLRHLGELLQAASEDLSGPEQLLEWLDAERNRPSTDDGDAADEMQLRVESDAARVRLMTLHASKGLEFPVVVLPLMWASKHNTQDTIELLHDPGSGRRVPGFGELDKLRYRQEGQDERFRLLYVAMTRARHACHVYVLPPTRPATATSRKADADPNRAPLDAIIERMFPLLEAGQWPQLAHDHIHWSNAGWPWPYGRYQPFVAGAQGPRVALPEPRPARFTYKWSFSSLTRSNQPGALEEGAASDESQEDATADALTHALAANADVEGGAAVPGAADEAPHPDLLALAPIAGAEFGNALHAMFELREIGKPMSVQHELIRHCLLDSGVRLGDLDQGVLVRLLAQRVQDTLDTPLPVAGGRAIALGALGPRQMRAEMEFHYVLGDVAMQRLRAACAAEGEPDLVPKTSTRLLRGLMTGKIDLVFQHDGRFHVLDYKGNRLGDQARVSGYGAAQLQRVMDQHHYRFQALLYVVAVDRYLRQRLGDAYERSRDLGETFYLFVRAVGLAPGAGIWTHRFADTLIDAVDGVLATAQGQGA